MDEKQAYDPIARRRALIGLCVGGALGLALIVGFERGWPMLESWLLADPQQLQMRGTLVFMLLALMLALPLWGFGGYLLRLAQRTANEGRYPPSGVAVVREVTVLRGDAAQRKARGMRVFAALFGVMGVILILLFWQLARVLLPN